MHTSIYFLALFVNIYGYKIIPLSRIDKIFTLKEGMKDENSEMEGEGISGLRVGSKGYYEGFVSSPILDDSINTSDRGNGLDQALKLGAGAAASLAVLTLKSNGLV